METYKGIPCFYAKNQAAWRKWLTKNGLTQVSVWLIIYKKDSGTSSVYYDAAVDEALCFGWIDSKANKRDELSYYQYFCKRKPSSKWSRVNKQKIEKLTTAGKMAPAGLAAVEVARQNGTWSALDLVEELVLPAEMELLLQENEKAFAHWQDFSRSVRRGILEWIYNAKQPATRQKRIAETIRLAAENIKANQYQGPV